MDQNQAAILSKQLDFLQTTCMLLSKNHVVLQDALQQARKETNAVAVQAQQQAQQQTQKIEQFRKSLHAVQMAREQDLKTINAMKKRIDEVDPPGLEDPKL